MGLKHSKKEIELAVCLISMHELCLKMSKEIRALSQGVAPQAYELAARAFEAQANALVSHADEVIATEAALAQKKEVA